MTVKVITDSSSDIPPEVARELGITIVPMTVIFGDEAYLDGVEITADEYYTRLVNTPVWPTTSSPSVGKFVEVYNKLADETDEIIAVLVTAKLAPCYGYGLNARDIVEKNCRIELIDGGFGAGALGLLAITAAEAANAGASLDEVVAIVRQSMPRTHLLVFFDTLKYLERGGRIGKARALMGALLRAKPLVSIKDGEVYPMGRVRNRREGLERLYKFAASFPSVSKMIIEHTNSPEDADSLVQRIGNVFPEERIIRSRMGPVIGTHLGPGAVAVAVLEE